MRRAYAAAKKHSKKLVLKMGRRQQPGQKAPQVRHILLSGRLPRAVAAWMRISSAACKSIAAALCFCDLGFGKDVQACWSVNAAAAGAGRVANQRPRCCTPWPPAFQGELRFQAHSAPSPVTTGLFNVNHAPPDSCPLGSSAETVWLQHFPDFTGQVGLVAGSWVLSTSLSLKLAVVQPCHLSADQIRMYQPDVRHSVLNI